MDPMSRQRFAGIALIAASAVVFLGQFIALLLWDSWYFSLQFNLVSDLGHTGCAPVADGFLPRFVCSPGHLWFNLGLIAGGVLLLVGGVALRRLPGHSLAMAGVALAVAGAFPHDRQPGLHDAAAVVYVVARWAAVIAAAATLRHTRPVSAVASVVVLLVSVGGAALLLFHPEGAPGLYGRLVVDVLAVWVVFVGAGQLRPGRSKPRRADPDRAERDAAVRRAAERLG